MKYNSIAPEQAPFISQCKEKHPFSLAISCIKKKAGKNISKGFTLLEVLIALAVLSTSMLGVYSLLKMSVETNIYARDKLFVIERAYDRISSMINYPMKIYEDKEEYNGVSIEYKYDLEATPIPALQQVRMTVTTNKAQTEFIFYQRVGRF